MRRLLAVAAIVIAGACAEPTDILYTQPLVTAVEVQPGLFQVTDDPNPDQVRGFTATGDTILFRGYRFTTGTAHWEILAMPAAGGIGFTEHAQLYRLALRYNVGTLVSRAQDRVLTWWLGNDTEFDGPAGCPHMRHIPVWTLAFLHLPSEDGIALSAAPRRLLVTPAVSGHFRVRFTPAEVEVDQGANPFGPALAPTGAVGFYSDGDSTWRFDIDDTTAAPTLIGAGIFPAVSSDGAMLAAATASGVDSTSTSETFVFGFSACTQVEISYTVAQWTTVVTKLATGDTVAKIDGTEPVFDPAGGRVLVRRSTGLVWVDLKSKAETPIENTAGAFSVAVSPSGKYAAFSKLVSKNVDVYYVKLQ